MDIRLQQYIKNNYDGNYSTWFQEECKRTYHTNRIENMLDIKEYLSGTHAILNRPDETWNGKILKVRKIILQYAKVILAFETSFLLSNPVTLTSEDKETLTAFKNVYTKNKYNMTDFKLLDKMCKYGQVYEYLYIDAGQIKSKIILPEDSYPVYDNTGAIIAFIEFYVVDGTSYYIIYENDVVRSYNDNGGNGLKQTDECVNLSGLPVVYKTMNEEDETQGRSSLEDIISVLDSMEDLISKYTDSFYKYLNPLPVITGTKLNIGANGEGSISPNVVGNTLQLDDNSTFDLVTGKMDHQSLKELYSILKQSLLDCSMTPGISMNSQSISNLSEVSIKMLFYMAEVKGIMNSMALKEGFIDRWDKIKKLLSLLNINVSGEIDCTFEMSIPENEKEIIENLKALREINSISLETLLSRSPYIYDVQTELTRLQAEGDKEQTT